VPASTKARLTSAAIWRIGISSRFKSVNNHFPYLPLVTNPENNPYIQTAIRIATKNLTDSAKNRTFRSYGIFIPLHVAIGSVHSRFYEYVHE